MCGESLEQATMLVAIVAVVIAVFVLILCRCIALYRCLAPVLAICHVGSYGYLESQNPPKSELEL